MRRHKTMSIKFKFALEFCFLMENFFQSKIDSAYTIAKNVHKV